MWALFLLLLVGCCYGDHCPTVIFDEGGVVWSQNSRIQVSAHGINIPQDGKILLELTRDGSTMAGIATSSPARMHLMNLTPGWYKATITLLRPDDSIYSCNGEAVSSIQSVRILWAPTATIVTVTHDRHDVLLDRCIPSVLKQDYPNLEYLVVADGKDPALREKFVERYGHDTRVQLIELGRNWQTWHKVVGWGAVPRKVATFLGTGDIFGYLDDDNVYIDADHISTMVKFMLGDGDSINSRQYDVVYSQGITKHVLADGRIGRYHNLPLGGYPPAMGSIDTSLLFTAASVLRDHNWTPTGYASDWGVVGKWFDMGQRFGYLQDHIGIEYHVALRGDRANA
eukprot:Rmarinus@m.1914